MVQAFSNLMHLLLIIMQAIELTSKEKITYIRYGYQNAFLDKSIDKDAALQVSAFNKNGYPLDQFIIKVE